MFSSIKKIYKNEEIFRATIVFTLAMVFVYAALVKISTVIWPFIVAIIFASIINTWVTKLQKLGCPRGIGAALFIIIIISILLLILIITSFFVQKNIAYYSKHINSTVKFLSEWIPSKLDVVATKFHLPLEINAEKIREYLMTSLDGIAEMLMNHALSMYERIKSVISMFSFLFLVPILTFYLAKDWPKFTSKIREYTPDKILTFADFCIPQVQRAIKKQMGGQVKVCFIVCVTYSFGLYFIGIKHFIFLGCISGILAFIPYIGSFIAFAIALISTISQGLPLVYVIFIASLYFIGSSIESNFLTPKLIGSKIGLHPVWIFFAVLTTFTCVGIGGAFFVMPLATIVWSTIQCAIIWLKEDK
ncbi:MAG: AI-2E family transporter [Holosporales bacterium]|jgi:putative permease|nr:AI-2E family transporter [Holosporales bacterium]